MTSETDKARLVALTNKLALANAETLVTITNGLAKEFGPFNAVTVVVDAALMGALAVLDSAVHAGSIEPTMPTPDALRRRLDYILSLSDYRLHHRRPDGSFDPAGVALN
ncbi:MAG: hypothetical protein DI537_36415 [Stutzerimonas stutzeri]|nr:MAG: hypothetical protein DI537_36415 [Stutzerimonas stutzeri]